MQAQTTVEDVEDVVEDDDVKIYDFEHVEVYSILGNVAIFGGHRADTTHDFGAIEILD